MVWEKRGVCECVFLIRRAVQIAFRLLLLLLSSIIYHYHYHYHFVIIIIAFSLIYNLLRFALLPCIVIVEWFRGADYYTQSTPLLKMCVSASASANSLISFLFLLSLQIDGQIRFPLRLNVCGTMLIFRDLWNSKLKFSVENSIKIDFHHLKWNEPNRTQPTRFDRKLEFRRTSQLNSNWILNDSDTQFSIWIFYTPGMATTNRVNCTC